MNDRIDELLWQAGGFNKISNPNDSFLDGRYILTQEQLDMFAELIVRECVDIACQYDEPKMSGPGMIIAGRIETHFGVEE